MEFSEIQQEADNIVKQKWTAGISLQFGTPDQSFCVTSGYMDDTSEKNIDSHTLYDLASVSKLFFLVAIMKLQEENILDIKHQIGDYTPLFPNISHVRLFELMNFTANLSTSSRIDLCHEKGEALKLLYQIQETGSNPQYSDMGIIVITLVIDEILGGPGSFKAYLLRLWQQIGLKETYCWTDLPKERLPYTLSYDKEYRIAKGQLHTIATSLGQVHDKKAQILGFSGHAGIFSTASDIALFSKKLISHQILKASTLELITSDKYTSFSPTQTYGLMCYKKNPDQKLSEIPFQSSQKSIAISGFTGVYLLLDFDLKHYVFIGSNRINNRLSEDDNSLSSDSQQVPWVKYVKEYVYRKDSLRDLCVQYLLSEVSQA